MTSMRKYLNKMDGQGFAACVQFIGQQASLLGAPINSDVDLGQVMVDWAHYLSQEADASDALIDKALTMMASTKPVDTYNKAQSLHNTLMGRTNFLSKVFGSVNEVAKVILAHPFYQTLQRTPLQDGFAKVQSTYAEYQKIKSKKDGVKSKLQRARDIVSNLAQPNINPGNVHIPASLTDSLKTLAAMDDVLKAFDEDGQMYYSPTATGNVVTAAAFEVANVYKDAVLTLDLNLARWQSIGYFSLMLNGIMRDQIRVETMAAMVAAQNDQYKEFAGMLTSVVK